MPKPQRIGLFSPLPTPCSVGCAVAALLALAVSPAGANDSNRALAAGGLVPEKSGVIAIASEDLSIAPTKITVAYQFRNLSDRPQHVLVAFPFAKAEVGGDVEASIPWDDPTRIFKFELRVRGQPQPVTYRIRYLDRAGQDVTAAAEAEGIRPSRLRYDGPHPDWSVHYEAFWEQDYAPGEEVLVEHRYTPIAGNAFSPPFARTMRKSFCAGESMIRRAYPEGTARSSPFFAINLQYILQTAKSWAGPIRRFHLTIENPLRDAQVALCGLPLHRVAPGRWEMRATNFVPDRDIDLLMLFRPNL